MNDSISPNTCIYDRHIYPLSILLFSVFQIYLFLYECQVGFCDYIFVIWQKKWTIEKIEQLIVRFLSVIVNVFVSIYGSKLQMVGYSILFSFILITFDQYIYVKSFNSTDKFHTSTSIRSIRHCMR